MATFEIKAVKIDRIEDHPNADKLEMAYVGGFRSLVPIGTYKEGEIVIYLPEASVLQDWMIKDMNLWDEEKGKGVLAGKAGNRIKAIRLRGIVSQGLLWPVETCTMAKHKFRGFMTKSEVGASVMMNSVQFFQHDFAEYLGIVKYEPVIPTSMAGEVMNAFGHTIKYDIDNIQKFPDVFKEDDYVAVTEKIHGTWMSVGFDTTITSDELYMDSTIINSKGVSDRGQAFKWNEANENNLYIKTFKEVFMDKWDMIISYMKDTLNTETFYIVGEVFGKGVQDLHYGCTNKGYRVFDIYIGSYGSGKYLDYYDLKMVCDQFKLEMVPSAYIGQFDWDIMNYLRDGTEIVSGKAANLREGIVIKTLVESRNDLIGRKQLKYVSPDYLTRKGNTTEYN